MRRWNGWGDKTVTYDVPEGAAAWLAGQIGEATPPQDAALEDVLKTVPESTIKAHELISTAAEDRLMHARGQSLPDWLALRSGHIDSFPAGVAYPASEADIEALYAYARTEGISLIPYGGGTSVVGHINPEPGAPPAVTVDMSRMSQLKTLDKDSYLATFGAGVRGPQVEAELRKQGFMLGHFPQSYELSTLGGWIASRSSGQQSLHYGRIEHHFLAGRMVTPAGTLDMLPHPASAAGPDLRQMVLGSEGRMGIITEATVRVSPLPEAEEFHAIFFPNWEQGVAAAKEMVQARLALSMLRLSNGAETEANMTLAGHENLVNFAHRGMNAIGYRRPEKCMLLFGATGHPASVRQAISRAKRIARRYGGFYVGQYMGKTWEKSRFLTPYLRNTLWELGYAIDTLETIVPWSQVLPAADAITGALSGAIESMGERAYVFAHLSHLYRTGASIYVTYIFRIPADGDELLARWVVMKQAASEQVTAFGGTISHQHGVGMDHAPFLEAEKGPLGMELIRKTARQCDPEGLLNPGKLFDPTSPALAARYTPASAQREAKTL